MVGPTTLVVVTKHFFMAPQGMGLHLWGSELTSFITWSPGSLRLWPKPRIQEHSQLICSKRSRKHLSFRILQITDVGAGAMSWHHRPFCSLTKCLSYVTYEQQQLIDYLVVGEARWRSQKIQCVTGLLSTIQDFVSIPTRIRKSMNSFSFSKGHRFFCVASFYCSWVLKTLYCCIKVESSIETW